MAGDCHVCRVQGVSLLMRGTDALPPPRREEEGIAAVCEEGRGRQELGLHRLVPRIRMKTRRMVKNNGYCTLCWRGHGCLFFLFLVRVLLCISELSFISPFSLLSFCLFLMHLHSSLVFSSVYLNFMSTCTSPPPPPSHVIILSSVCLNSIYAPLLLPLP